MNSSNEILELNWSRRGTEVAYHPSRGVREPSSPIERRNVEFEDKKAGIVVGSSVFETVSTQMKSEWKDELLIVHQGRATIELADGGRIALSAGETAFISAGTVHRWIYHEPFAKHFLWLLDGESGAPTAIKVDPASKLLRSAPPGDDLLLTGIPDCQSSILHQRTDGRLPLMLWSSTPYRRRSVPHPKHELMCFIAGAATLRDSRGKTTSCGPLSTVFVPRGVDVGWESDTDVLKIACFIS